MNKAKGEYELNGWLIMASEMYNDWDCFPKDLSDSQWDEFNNNECKTFKRLAEAKKFVKTVEADELKEKYSKI